MSFQPYLNFVYEYYAEHFSPLRYFIDLLDSVDWSIIPERSHSLGRKGYSLRTLYKIFFISAAQGLKTYPAIREFFLSHPTLIHYVGIKVISVFSSNSDCFPSEATLSRFIHHYFDHDLFLRLYKDTLDKVDIDTSNLFVDSHPILANSALNNPKNFSSKKPSRDHDARFGVKAKSNDGKSDFIYFFGYKKHVVSAGPVPLYSIITPANASDSKQLIPLLKAVNSHYDISSSNVCADKGYDSNENHDYIFLSFKGHSFIPKRRTAKGPDSIPVGRCGSLLKLHSTYYESKRNRIRQKYVCPLNDYHGATCPFGNAFNAPKYGCTAYLTLKSGRFRDWIDPKSNTFKKVYRYRMRIENLFSIIETNRLDRVSGYGIDYVNARSAMIDLFMLANAILAQRIGHPELIGSPGKLKRVS